MSEPAAPRPAREHVPHGIRVAGAWSGYFLVICAALTVVFWALARLGLVTVAFVTGVMVAALLQPLVALLVRRGLNRGLAAVVAFVTGFGAIGLLLWFVVAQVQGSSADFSRELGSAERGARDWLVDGPVGLDPTTADKYTVDLSKTLGAHSNDVASQATTHLGAATGAVSGFVLTLFCILFLLADDGRIWRWCVRLLPRRAHDYADLAGAAAWKTLVVYMRSLVLLAVLNAAAMLPILWIAGVPLAVPLTVALFLGSLIPLVGVLIAAVLVFVVALVGKGIVTAIVMMVALALVIQLFGNLVNPIILGKVVDLHPLVILLGVTAGTILGGTFGAFTAVPLIAVVNNMVKVVRRYHLEREGGDDLDGGSPARLQRLAEDAL